MILKFLNVERLVSSDEFLDASRFAMEHLKQHGDSGYLKMMLDCLSTSPKYHAILEWYCQNGGLMPIVGDGDVGLRRIKKKPPVGTVPLAHCLGNFKGTKKAVMKQITADRENAAFGPAYVDVMETGRVVPGSYGAGKKG